MSDGGQVKRAEALQLNGGLPRASRQLMVARPPMAFTSPRVSGRNPTLDPGRIAAAAEPPDRVRHSRDGLDRAGILGMRPARTSSVTCTPIRGRIGWTGLRHPGTLLHKSEGVRETGAGTAPIGTAAVAMTSEERSSMNTTPNEAGRPNVGRRVAEDGHFRQPIPLNGRRSEARRSREGACKGRSIWAPRTADARACFARRKHVLNITLSCDRERRGDEAECRRGPCR